jgi:hypothetical protein
MTYLHMRCMTDDMPNSYDIIPVIYLTLIGRTEVLGMNQCIGIHLTFT